MTRTANGSKIGPRMMDALFVIHHNPGCTKMLVARRVGPNQSLNFGYRTVDRAIAAGLVTATPIGRGYHLTLTDEGEQAYLGY